MISFSFWSLTSLLTVFNFQVFHGASGGGTAPHKFSRLLYGAAHAQRGAGESELRVETFLVRNPSTISWQPFSSAR